MQLQQCVCTLFTENGKWMQFDKSHNVNDEAIFDRVEINIPYVVLLTH